MWIVAAIVFVVLFGLVVWVDHIYQSGKEARPYGGKPTRVDYIRAVRGLQLTKFERKVFKRGFYHVPRRERK